MELYYYIDDVSFFLNSTKTGNFVCSYLVYSDPELKHKTGTINFNSNNLSNSNNINKIKQNCQVSLVLNNGINLNYDYVRDGLKEICTSPTYSNYDIKKCKRTYINKNLRKLKLKN